jgi:hypothetical protein
MAYVYWRCGLSANSSTEADHALRPESDILNDGGTGDLSGNGNLAGRFKGMTPITPAQRYCNGY